MQIITKGDNMTHLEKLKNEAQILEHKALIYFNELGDLQAYKRVKNELDKVNESILNLMIKEQEDHVKRFTIK